MNARRLPNDPAEEAAALWAARLDGDVLDARQRSDLDAWLAASPRHRELLSRYCQLSADLEQQVPALVAAGAVSLPATKRSRWTFPRVASLALAAAAAIAMGWWSMRPAPQIENIATSVAELRTHTLADGSKVELNAHTSVRFENTRTERRARLASGEALFSVAKDPARPFVVETPSGTVRVTGTVFNVRTESATAFEVTVLEGSVQARAADFAGPAALVPVPLSAGEQFSATPAGPTVRKLARTAIEDVTAWREGFIVFNGMPLAEAAARVARYHGRRITVSSGVAHLGVGGRHRIENLGDFLGALEMALPVKPRYDLDGAVFIEPRP